MPIIKQKKKILSKPSICKFYSEKFESKTHFKIATSTFKNHRKIGGIDKFLIRYKLKIYLHWQKNIKKIF